MRRILLVEPGYRNKYPPLGLMKISTYHKLKGDYVYFVKGCRKDIQRNRWDRIYISTLFTFHWKIIIDTIKYYIQSVTSPEHIYVGGVAATLLHDDLRQLTGATIIRGLLDKPGILDPGDKCIIDTLIPDYSIIKQSNYVYGLTDAYIAYATRGCPNRCGFCAVGTLEPNYCHYLPLRRQIKSIEEVYGPKQHLVLLDNNVLASERFEQIINEIIELGFEKGAKFKNKRRYVDFNQGLDLRLLTPKKIRLLSKIALKPMRIAFDHISLRNMYIEKVKMAVEMGIPNISTYVLYNYTDTPEDFYERLRINVELNKTLGTQIYSFPMKYVPLDAKDRSYVGKNWNRRLLRGVQCILLATKGKVGTHLDFFEAAFGRSPEEFIEIAMMPERYIIYRRFHENNGAKEWRLLFKGLTEDERKEFIKSLCNGEFSPKYQLQEIMKHYNKEKVRKK